MRAGLGAGRRLLHRTRRIGRHRCPCGELLVRDMRVTGTGNLQISTSPQPLSVGSADTPDSGTPLPHEIVLLLSDVKCHLSLCHHQHELRLVCARVAVKPRQDVKGLWEDVCDVKGEVE